MALTPIGNVVLLLHCDDSSGSTLTDSSPYGLHGACKGTAATSAAQSMFGGRSLLTGNANGNYAAVGTNQALDFGTGDFTIELFLYPLSQGSDGGAILGRWDGTHNDFLLMRASDGSMQVSVSGTKVLQTSAGDLPTTGFTHVALTRQAGTLNAWVGGVNKGSVSFPGAINFTRGTPIYIGQSNLSGGATWLQAYFDEIRITNGVAQYTANFVPPAAAFSISDSSNNRAVAMLMHMDGSNGSTTFTDVLGNTATAQGAAQISTAQSKFGGASALLSGAVNTAVSVANNSGFDLTSGDFTLEFWAYPLELRGWFLCKDGVGGSAYPQWGVRLNTDGSVQITVGDGQGTTSVQDIKTAANAMNANAWTHVACVRSGTTMLVFLNGTQAASATQAASMRASNQPLLIGGQISQPGSQDWYHGYIDEIRLTKGVARYLASFTPPAAPFSDPTVPTRTVKTPRAFIRACKWYPFASAKPVVRPAKPNITSGLKDAIFGGTGKIAGTVDVAPNTPVSRKVWLLDERCMLPVRSTWSDPVTGAYQFRWIDTGRTYTVQAYDYTKTYRAVIANGVIPDPM